MSLRNRLFQYAIALLAPARPKISATIYDVNYGGCLSGKTFVVVGGTKGIGKAIATKFCKEGANIIVTGRSETLLQEMEKEFQPNCKTISFDNSNIDCIEDFVKSWYSLSPTIDGVVLNAGISLHEGNFIKVSPKGFSEQITTNLTSHYFIAQQYIKHLIANELGGVFYSSHRKLVQNAMIFLMA